MWKRFEKQTQRGMVIDKSKFGYTYVPEHLKEKVKNHQDLSFCERFHLIAELS
jgi:hypothetical protein